MNIKDTGEHLVAHELLEREIKQLNRSLRGSMDTVSIALDQVNGMMRKVDGNVQSLQRDFAVTQEKFEHVATGQDLSTAIATCSQNHFERASKPVNWKAITALITGVIAAVAAATVVIIQSL